MMMTMGAAIRVANTPETTVNMVKKGAKMVRIAADVSPRLYRELVTEVSLEKSALRAMAMGIAPATVRESERVVASIREVLMRHGWRVALTFLASPGEVDLGGLSGTPGLVLLVTRTPRHGPLTVHALTDRLETHPFGYRQPLKGEPLVDPAAIEVVFVPGVLFAVNGGRLGRGKGYFDKLLSTLHPRPYLIGATLDRRVVSKLPMTESDVYMDAITTESGFREAHAIASS